jgi:hypothetical protein
MTETTLLLVEVAAPLQVLFGWREWRKLRWTVKAEFDPQQNGGEPFLYPRWLSFARYVDRSECRDEEHQNQSC